MFLYLHSVQACVHTCVCAFVLVRPLKAVCVCEREMGVNTCHMGVG